MALVLSAVVPAVLVLGFGHRGVHAARNLLFPGAGLIEERPLLAVALALAGIGATVAWLRWGLDWLVVAVVAGSMALSAALTPPAHPLSTAAAAIEPAVADRSALGTRSAPDAPVAGGAIGGRDRSASDPSGPDPDRSGGDGHGGGRRPVDGAAHEFPLVMLVMTALAWLRSVAWRIPGVGWWSRRRVTRRPRAGLADVGQLPVPDRSRCAALLLLGGADPATDPEVAAAVAAGTGDDAVRRARRVAWWARGRRGAAAVALDHAHLRAAQTLLPTGGGERLADAGERAPLGVPASEPGWVRPLDATLAALALGRGDGSPRSDEVGERWRQLVAGPLALRRSHRPAWIWTPLALAAGRPAPWEQAAWTALSRWAGWVSDDADWVALRRRVLGAAARGTARPADERLIAAGRIWLALVDDPEAARIVARPTVGSDPLAVALDRLATAVTVGPHHSASRPPC